MFALIAIPIVAVAVFVLLAGFLRPKKANEIVHFQPRLGESLGFRTSSGEGVTEVPSDRPAAAAEPDGDRFISHKITWNPDAFCMNMGEPRATCRCPKCKGDRRKYGYS